MFIIVLSTISSTEKKFRDDDERYEFDLLEIWQLDFTHQILYKTFMYTSADEGSDIIELAPVASSE